MEDEEQVQEEEQEDHHVDVEERLDHGDHFHDTRFDTEVEAVRREETVTDQLGQRFGETLLKVLVDTAVVTYGQVTGKGGGQEDDDDLHDYYDDDDLDDDIWPGEGGGREDGLNWDCSAGRSKAGGQGLGGPDL